MATAIADFGEIGLRAFAASRLPCKVSADAAGTLRLRQNRTKSPSRGQRSAGRCRTFGDAKVWPQFSRLRGSAKDLLVEILAGRSDSKFRYARTHDDLTTPINSYTTTGTTPTTTGAPIVGAERRRSDGPGPDVMDAATLDGDTVVNSSGEDLGKIEAIMLDVTSGRIAYAVLSFGWLPGDGFQVFCYSLVRIDA